ncbi:unnamed protein product [Rotaria sp. Silwood1]|nr:unnamed protein product [Rotaria sp. Silwood1]
MTRKSNRPILLQLSVEILHRILDYLDTDTILLSVFLVCTQLQMTVKSYDRYIVDVAHIPKKNFVRTCKMIRPKNITKLIIFKGNTELFLIRKFLSLVNIRRFTRLQAKIDKLKLILKHVPSLINFTVFKYYHACEDCINGAQWKHLIQKHLSLLEKFHFIFVFGQYCKNDKASVLRSLVITYPSRFWIENKRWFVTGDHYAEMYLFILYSTSLSNVVNQHRFSMKKISHSTSIQRRWQINP